jgi:hypothetical protein
MADAYLGFEYTEDARRAVEKLLDFAEVDARFRDSNGVVWTRTSSGKLIAEPPSPRPSMSALPRADTDVEDLSQSQRGFSHAQTVEHQRTSPWLR